MTKAVALLSGGLDSTLAVKVMLDQGIEVTALNFVSPFCTCNTRKKAGGCKSEAMRVAEEFGIPIKVMNKGLAYVDIIRNPKYGYGQGINPCVDCRIYMLKMAKSYMEEIGADFLFTGEVLGQRPMSQRLDAFKSVEEDTGLEGRILRPLCAHSLEPTIPEREGLVDRERLLNMVGRSRRQQMDLAEELDINDYPCPSGGCLLTDKIFSKKVRDLIDHKSDVSMSDLLSLKSGRHFRRDGVKVIVGKDAADNEALKRISQPEDTVLEPVDFSGPVVVVKGGLANGASANGTEAYATGLLLRYSSGKGGGGGTLRATTGDEVREFSPGVEAVSEETLDETMICR